MYSTRPPVDLSRDSAMDSAGKNHSATRPGATAEHEQSHPPARAAGRPGLLSTLSTSTAVHVRVVLSRVQYVSDRKNTSEEAEERDSLAQARPRSRSSPAVLHSRRRSSNPPSAPTCGCGLWHLGREGERRRGGEAERRRQTRGRSQRQRARGSPLAASRSSRSTGRVATHSD